MAPSYSQASCKVNSRRLLSIFALLLVLASCASGPGRDSGGFSLPSLPGAPDERNVEALLEQAGSLESPQAEMTYLEAARLLAEMDREDEAAEVLESLDTAPLDPPLAADILLLMARLHVEGARPETALELLEAGLPVPMPMLPESLQRDIRLLRARAYLDAGQPLASARERIDADSLLGPEAIRENHEAIWQALTALPAQRLTGLAEEALGFEFQGWYELAGIGRVYRYNLDRQAVELMRWRETWRRHPAARVMPREMQLVTTLAEERPDRIALLLPLQTPAGRVVRNGFMTAYFDAQDFGASVPEIRFYDTSTTEDILTVYQQAIDDGAQMVIGPLQKPFVDRLQQQDGLAVPTLALNNIENAAPRAEQLYQFALSPENEARQIARRAWRDGHRYAAVLSPLENAGQDYFTRKRESFIRQWRELGGRIVAREVYRNDYTTVIENLLNLTASQYRRDQLDELLDRPVQFTQRRRQDIDFIYLIAQPGPARQINPSLAYLYAGDIPVYATQDVYSGTPKPLEDSDLNGILFAESPWLLSDGNRGDTLKDTAKSLFPQDTALYLRLQAFGVDAYRLYPRLQQLKTVAGSRIFGATGVLVMDDNRRIHQELSWARFEEGRARLVDEPL